MEADPRAQLGQLICGYWFTQAIFVAARLEIADRLEDKPLPVDELARLTGAHEKSLYRLLRMLASAGIFEERAGRQFAQTPMSELLRSDVPGSQRATALMIADEQYRAWGHLLESVQTGETAFDKVFGKPIFDYLSEHPNKAEIFDRAMLSIHGHETAAILDAYDFSAFQSIADVGGGNGSMLCGILARYRNLHGTLFDLPATVARARTTIEAAGMGNRVHAVAGDFFESVPAGLDAYLLRHIIHDWEDAKAIRILERVRQAMEPHARVLVVESVIPLGNEPFFGKLLDLVMLVGPGGQERTEAEYRDLFGKAGFRLARVVPTTAEVSVIEGMPQ